MRFLISILFLIIGFVCNAQSSEKFYCSYGGNGSDEGNDVKQTLDGGYIIIGSTSSIGQGNTDMYLLKLDSMGHVIFQKTFGGVSNDIGKSIVQLSDSNYVMAGYTSSTGIGGYDFFVVKVDKKGNLIWQKNYGGIDWDFANSIDTITGGGFIIAGTTYSYGNGKADGYVIKIDADGNSVWTKTFGGLNDDEFKSVIQLSNGDFALTGYTKSFNDSLGDGWILKIDQNGIETYSASVGGIHADKLNDITELTNHDLYFVGSNTSYKNGTNSVNWRYSINSSNTLVLDDYVGNSNTERYNSNTVGLNGTVVSIGYNNFMSSSSDANIHVCTPSLGYISYFPFGVANTDELFSVSRTKDKGFVAVGSCIENTSSFKKILFVKTDSLGRYGNSIIGINENEKDDVNLEIYPNPTNDFIKIKFFNYRDYKNKNYKIIDLNGRVVLSNIINEMEQTIEISTISDGLYFVQVFDSNNLISSSKISIIK